MMTSVHASQWQLLGEYFPLCFGLYHAAFITYILPNQAKQATKVWMSYCSTNLGVFLTEPFWITKLTPSEITFILYLLPL